MSPTETAFIIIGVIAALAGAAYVVQSIETQKKQRKLLLQTLRSDIRHAEQIYEAIPKALMSESLFRFQSSTILGLWNRLLSLEATPQLQQAYEATKAHFSDGFTPQSLAPGSMTLTPDLNSTQLATGAIKQLAQWLNQLNQKPSADHQSINEMIRYTQQCFQLLAVDKMVHEAVECEQMKGATVAVHQFRNCLTTLENFDHWQLADRQAYEIRTHIARLEDSDSETDSTDQSEPENTDS